MASEGTLPGRRVAGRPWTGLGPPLVYPVLGLGLAVFVVYPLAALLVRAVDDGGRVSLAPLGRLLTDRYTWTVLTNTLFLGLTVAVVGTALAAVYAYAMSRVAMPAKGFFHFVALLPTISPPILAALSLILLYGRRGLITHGLFGLNTTALYGYWGLVAAQVLGYFPFAYLLLLSLFRGLDASLEEAAWTMGAPPRTILRTVSLPLLVPGFASALLLLFGYSFADLGNPLLLGGDYPVLAAQIYLTIIGQYDVPRGAALALVLLVPATVLFVAHKRLAARMAFASVGGRATGRHPQARGAGLRLGAFAFCAAVSLLILLQYATVLAGAATRLFGINNALTLRHFASALTLSRAVLLDTVGLAAVASVVSGVVGVLVAFFVGRTTAPGRAAMDFVASLPLAVPGTVIGLGFALAFNRRPLLLTGTAAIIIAVFAVRTVPYAIRSAVASLHQLDRSLDEASTTMGATSFQTLRRVTLPLVRSAVVAGMIFTFTRSVTSLSAVIFVVSPHWSLVTPTILSQMDRGDVGEAAALSVLLIGLVLVMVHGAPRLLGADWRRALVG